MAQPFRYVLDPRIIGTPDADRAHAACTYDAIDLGHTIPAKKLEALAG